MGRSEYAALLRRAGADLQALRNMADTFAFDEGIFGFHAQQACEKALKAWLLHLGHKPPHIHDLRGLILLLADRGAIVGEAPAIAAPTVYAVELRYDDEPPQELLDRPATVALCERLLSRVQELERH